MNSERLDIVFDIETDGFNATKIHCLVCIDINRGEVWKFADHPGYLPISEGVALLEAADSLIGHNILGFDIPKLTKLAGARIDRSKACDTLIGTRILWPDLRDADAAACVIPVIEYGKHSLRAWGHRLGCHKGEFNEWARFSHVMMTYCVNDCMASWQLYLYLRDAAEADSAALPFFQTDYYALERDTKYLCNEMTENGFRVDVTAAQTLLGDLEQRGGEVAAELQVALPPQWVETTITPKRDNKTRGYIKGVPFTKRKLIPFNPASGAQFAARMMALYAWQPRVLTDTGAPCTNAKVLGTLPYREAKVLLAYKTIAKRQTMLTGERGLLNTVGGDGYLHTEYFTLGTVTGRASHSPNVAQIPKVHSSKQHGVLKGVAGAWGFEFRSLFLPPPGWLLVGADMAGLELRNLAHYLSPYDNGQYSRLVCDGDVHTANQMAAGLDSRDTAKTLAYAVLYGAGDYRAGIIVDPDEDDEYMVRAIGQAAKEGLISGICGFQDLFRWVDSFGGNEIPGLDGRPLFARKKHTRLNTLLQACGAILCKRWLLLIAAELDRLGLYAGHDFCFAAWIHDEVQIAVRTQEIAEIVRNVCIAMAVEAGRYYTLQCPTAGSAKIGANWAETH